MLFYSPEFILGFLPATFLIFFFFDKIGWRRAAIMSLVVASCFFYAWFSIKLLVLFGTMILFNYALGLKLARDFHKRLRNPLQLAFGISVNLAVLGYFKYTNFVLSNSNAVVGTHFVLQNVILPIGISFFTFQKIAYLVDAYNGDAEPYSLLEFALFVMFFPQLIAGPIVHHKEIIPQFRSSDQRISYSAVAAGCALFVIGMLKKVMIADEAATWSDSIFSAVKAGAKPALLEAWGGALAFTIQIYFDFSGYTDMALGLALLFGIRLPLNFNSPYKAASIVDFWHRWHMTLSRFLRDYIYIPLGGNRRGSCRRYVNLMATMLIGGLWHGAAWTFVIWGGLHGAYLMINHGWRVTRSWLGFSENHSVARKVTACLLTFVAVVAAWVLFRAETLADAAVILSGMVGRHGVILPEQFQILLGPAGDWLAQHWVTFDAQSAFAAPALALIASLFAVWLLPNSQQLLAAWRPALEPLAGFPLPLGQRFAAWLGLVDPYGNLRLNSKTGLITGMVLVGCLLYQAVRKTELHPFIYFQF